jgi:hypothetical protein
MHCYMHFHCRYKGNIDLKLILKLKLAKVVVKMMFILMLFDILKCIVSFFVVYWIFLDDFSCCCLIFCLEYNVVVIVTFMGLGLPMIIYTHLAVWSVNVS